MRKLRVLSLILAILLVLPLMFACKNNDEKVTDEGGEKTSAVKGPITVSDVEKNPLKVLGNGRALAMEASPFAALPTGDGLSMELSLSDGGSNAASLVVSASNDLDAYFKMDADIQGEALEVESYFVDGQLVVKSELLEEFFGTDALGVNLLTFLEDLPDSEFFEAVLEMSGASLGADEEMIFDLMSDPAITRMLSDLMDEITALLENLQKYEISGEETLSVGGTDVSVIVVEQVLNEAAFDTFIDRVFEIVVDAVLEIAPKLGAELPSEAELEEAMEEARESAKLEIDRTLEQIQLGDATYYLSEDTGALVREEFAFEPLLSWELTYGADPTAEFLPEFVFSMMVDGDELCLTGKTVKDGDSTVTSGDVSITSQGDVEGGTYTFTHKASGDFEFAAYEDGEEIFTVTGALRTTANGFDLDLDLPIDGDNYTLGVKFENKASVPSVPKYKNILDFSLEDLTGLMFGGMSGMGGFADVESSMNYPTLGMDF